MQSQVWRFLHRLFPVHPHEWPKALVLLSLSTLVGMSFSLSRASGEALFLAHFGVGFLPYLLLANPVMIVVASTVYGAYADRIPDNRLLIYTALFPLPLILGMRGLIFLNMTWVYFFLYAVALAYSAILYISWTVYIVGHYDAQEAKRLIPFITSGQLIGTVMGGMSVALCAPRLGAANVLFVWMSALIGVAAMVWWVSRRFTALETISSKAKRSTTQPGVWQNFREGLGFALSSALLLATTATTIASMLAVQLLEYEYSTIFTQAYPDPTALTAFLGMFDGCATLVALLMQWFVTPWFLRHLRVQGTNVLFPYLLLTAFGSLLLAPTFLTAMWARGTRMGFMASLRGTMLNLMLNAVPRKMAARVRNFNTGLAMPIGQVLGAILLLTLKSLGIPMLFPALGLLVGLVFVYFSYRQNAAYGTALLGLLREDKIHLLDLQEGNLQQFDTTVVAAISERLRQEQASFPQQAAFLVEGGQNLEEITHAHEESSLAAIALLRAIGSTEAAQALPQHLPFASPDLTAAALQAIAAIGDSTASATLRPYLQAPEAQIRVAALQGLHRLQDPTVHDQAVLLLEHADPQVRAAALTVVFAASPSPATARAHRVLDAMVTSAHVATVKAALPVIPLAPEMPLKAHVYGALVHADPQVRQEALGVLQQLAATGGLSDIPRGVLQALTDTDIETRELALHVLVAIGTPAALEHMLTLLNDEQPRVREALVRAIKPFGLPAVPLLLQRLMAPQTSLLAKETALLAFARLEGARAADLAPFWEEALRDLYQCKLMLSCLQDQNALEGDAFLGAALQDQHDEILALLLHLLAVWTSPDVARLVESGLRDSDHYQRAHALEALESLGERHFIRLFLPILEAAEDQAATWRDVARQQWHLRFPDVPTMLDTCLHSSDRWVVIGALLAGQARATIQPEAWRKQLLHIAESTTELEVRNTANRLLGHTGDTPPRTLSLTDVILFLKRVPLYRSLRLDQLYTMAMHMTARDVVAGEEILHEGDQSYEFYMIVSGRVNIVKARGETLQTLATLSAGDYFGDMAIFERLPRVASVVAVDTSILLVLSDEHFRRVILQDPAIAFEIFRELSSRLRHVNEIV